MVEPRIIEGEEDVGGSRVYSDNESDDEGVVSKKIRRMESGRAPPILDIFGKVQLAKY